MVWAGIPEKVVMQIGGWKTRAVFDRYNIVRSADLKRAAGLMDEYHERMESKTTAETATIAEFGAGK